jgi:hypothetical protein
VIGGVDPAGALLDHVQADPALAQLGPNVTA